MFFFSFSVWQLKAAAFAELLTLTAFWAQTSTSCSKLKRMTRCSFPAAPLSTFLSIKDTSGCFRKHLLDALAPAL